MTLKELLELNIIVDNVRVCYIETDNNCHYPVNVVELVRNNGLTPVTPKMLINVGLDEKFLSHQVIHIYGDKNKFKMGITIEK